MPTEEAVKLAEVSDRTGAPLPLVFPRTSAEAVSAMAHYYRAEMARMISWRDRIDRTANWAITVVAGMLSLALSSPTAHHSVIIVGMLIVFVLLLIESRRYRFFDVYRTRVRIIERNYYAQMFAPQSGEAAADGAWLRQLSEDLRSPRFQLPLDVAMARRLQRNYGWMYLVLLFAWVLKTTTSVRQMPDGQVEFVHSMSDLVANAATGICPGWLTILVLAIFYAALVVLMVIRRAVTPELAIGEVHV